LRSTKLSLPALCAFVAFLTVPAGVAHATGPNLGAIAISAGDHHTCAVLAGGGARCWGQNQEAQLGIGSNDTPQYCPLSDVIYASCVMQPMDVSKLAEGVSSIATGLSDACAIQSGVAKCWGDNGDGQVGDDVTVGPQECIGGERCAFRPTPVTGISGSVARITLGAGFVCAVTTGGAAKCWGLNSDGELGDGTTHDRTRPVGVFGLSTGVADISAGTDHACARTNGGAADCWGSNAHGQLGDGTTTDEHKPAAVLGLSSGVAAVATGAGHSCALSTAGAVECWGRNSKGELGDGTTMDRTTPVPVSGLSSGIAAISASGQDTCALTTTGAVKCWGDNSNGQLGDGTAVSKSVPTAVVGLNAGVSAVSVGGTHVCALRTAGDVRCWGDNDFGELGDGSLTEHHTPVAVSGLGASTPSSVDDTDQAVSMDGWVSVEDFSASGDFYRMSSMKGAKFIFESSYGTSLILRLRTGPDGGKASVSIDGDAKGTVDFYSASPATLTLRYSGLPLDLHQVTLKVLHSKDAASSGFDVRIDAFKAGGFTFDEYDSRVSLDAWKVRGSSASHGGTLQVSDSPTSTSTLTFYGSRVDWITAKGPGYGMASVSIDGVSQGTVDLYAASTSWQVLESYGGLSESAHTMVISVLGQKNPAASDADVVVDGFIVRP
jgi:alpha-tubulin suppressor-like RCC1 family protein